MIKDMTKGTPWKLIFSFMVPVCCGNIFQNFYNIVDSMIVGRFLGVEALAAVGSTSSINFLVIGWIVGMTSGFGIQLSQAFGANDRNRLRHYLAMSVYLCIGLAFLMTAGLLIANSTILQWMNTPEEIFYNTEKYIGIIYAGLPVTILYNMLATVARALGDSKTPLYFLVLSSVLNIILDFLFVAVLPFGVAGAAYATVLSQAVSAVLCIVYVWKKFPMIHFTKKDAGKRIRKNIGQIFRKYNLIEYKSPDDYVSINDYHKMLGYAHFFMADTMHINEIGYEEISISFACSKYQNKMMKYIISKGCTIEIKEKGIYYVHGEQFAIQLLVCSGLPEEENLWLKNLTNKITDIAAVEKLARDY